MTLLKSSRTRKISPGPRVCLDEFDPHREYVLWIIGLNPTPAELERENLQPEFEISHFWEAIPDYREERDHCQVKNQDYLEFNNI